MTCYSVQFHLSNKTDVALVYSWSFLVEEEVFRGENGCGWQAISQ